MNFVFVVIVLWFLLTRFHLRTVFLLLESICLLKGRIFSFCGRFSIHGTVVNSTSHESFHSYFFFNAVFNFLYLLLNTQPSNFLRLFTSLMPLFSSLVSLFDFFLLLRLYNIFFFLWKFKGFFPFFFDFRIWLN